MAFPFSPDDVPLKMVTVGWRGPAAYRGIRTAVAVSNLHTQESFDCQKRKKGDGMQKIPHWVCLVLNTTSNVWNASVLPFHTTVVTACPTSICLIKHSIHADASFGPISLNILSTKTSCFNPSTCTFYVYRITTLYNTCS